MAGEAIPLSLESLVAQATFPMTERSGRSVLCSVASLCPVLADSLASPFCSLKACVGGTQSLWLLSMSLLC